MESGSDTLLNEFAERLFAGKWIAGQYISDAIAASRDLNRSNMTAIVNYLGELYTEKDKVEKTVNTYMKLVKEIKKGKVHAEISVKITQLGLLIGKSFANKNYSMIVDFAKRNRVFVWLDMEEHNYVSSTLEIFKSKAHGRNTGICIQSYLKRSMSDLRSLSKLDANIRLVKGAHGVTSALGYPNRADATKNYAVLMDYLFKHFSRFTIATHDLDVIDTALKLRKRYKKEVTFAMLRGIRSDYALSLARKGNDVSVYVPFGEEWIPYSYRRLKEWSNFKLIARSLLPTQ